MAETTKYGNSTVTWYGDEMVAQVAAASAKATRAAANSILKVARRNVSTTSFQYARPAYKKGPYKGKRWTARIPGTLKKSGFIRRAKKYKDMSSGKISWSNIPKTIVKYQVIFGGSERRSLKGAERLAYYARFAEYSAVGKVGYRWRKTGSGWVTYQPKTYGRRYPIPHKPYLNPAVRASVAEVMSKFEGAMK